MALSYLLVGIGVQKTDKKYPYVQYVCVSPDDFVHFSSRSNYNHDLKLLILEEVFLVMTGIAFSKASLEKMLVSAMLNACEVE